MFKSNPNLTNRAKVEADELAAKGCMRWNTDKYQVGVFACDTDGCNRDLDQGDCAHVCEGSDTRVKKPQLKQQVLSHEPMVENKNNV